MKETILAILEHLTKEHVENNLWDYVREYFDANLVDEVADVAVGYVAFCAEEFDVLDAVEDAISNCEPF